jgi:SMODS and SLOG-associating 2TM effector domain family 5
MKQFISDLRTRAWRTSGSRYNAARRLKQRETFSTISLAMLSALSVAAAVAQRIYSPQAGTPLDNYLTAASVALGVFLLAISLLEWGAAYGAKSDALHRNAEDLTAYHLKLAHVLAKIEAGKTVEDSEVDALRVEYETIKDRCPYNHAPFDHELFRAQQRMAPEFRGIDGKPVMTAISAWLVKARWEWSTIWYFLLVWITIGIAGAYAFCIPKA